MKRSRGRVVDVETVRELERRLSSGCTSLRGWRLRGLDLTEHVDDVLARNVGGAVFLDCVLPGDSADRLARAGAQVLPGRTETPLDVDRRTLYTADELYDAPAYADTFDARTYAWSQGRSTTTAARSAALHDHAIDEALASWCEGRRIVGVMGGHALRRGESGYADAARLGHGLGAELVVATGGGPGAMEAANLGGRLAGRPLHAVDDALTRLADVPGFRPDVDAWLAPALAIASAADPRPSLGIPTWHYGHEPANVFATAIAKYVRNATREAVLLQVCGAGIVFLPGAGGTVQEVFQDACENYYADETSVAPMVLVGRAYWTRDLPAWPLLQALARGRAMETYVHLVDSVDEAVAVISGR